MGSDRVNNILGWLTCGIAFIVYALTAQQSVMFWDSGEFIASTYKLQVTHPPGAPLYTILSRAFTFFFPANGVAFACSLFSALCGAITIWFLYQGIIWLGERIITRLNTDSTKSSWVISMSGLVGATALTFSDTFWVSSTEAEVYTLSTVFMAAIFWAITRWDNHFGTRGNYRWLLLIAYLLGLSIGVHILNLAILFPVTLIISLRYYGLTFKGVSIGCIGAFLLFVVLNNGLVQGFLQIAGILEVSTVNQLGWSRHYGALLTIGLFIAGLIGGLVYARKAGKQLVQTILLGVFLFSIGWSSYAMVVIRSSVQTPISNNADDAVRLLDYLRSDQFGFSDRPLLYGPSFNSPLYGKQPFKDQPPTLVFDSESNKYVETHDGEKSLPNYHGDYKMVFPRMYNSDPINEQGYKRWVDFKGEKKAIKTDRSGSNKTIKLPTMGDNLAFFFNYQLGWLNFRYFMWNFAGRQNDIKGKGDPSGGNWASGISFLDESRIGSTEVIPEDYKNDVSTNEFYLLPLLLGLIGIAFLYYVAKSELMILVLFFIAFGVAITVFINQLPVHVIIRERDYIFLGAYYVFCMWIGIGVMGLCYWIPQVWHNHKKMVFVGVACLLVVPGQMAVKGWKDHNRSLDNEARILAVKMLDQCDENGILITSGDNITFPLWYMQEVEEYRTDVRVLNYNLLGLDWYIDRIQRRINQSPPLKLKIPQILYQKGRNTVFPLRKHAQIKSHREVEEILNYLGSAKKQKNIPTDLFQLTVDTIAMQKIGIDAGIYDAVLVPEVKWQLTKKKYGIQDIVLLDLLLQNKFERSVYFANTGAKELFLGLEDYLVNRGLVKQFLPIAPRPEKTWSQLVDINAMHKLVMDELDFKAYCGSGGYINFLNASFVKSTYRPIFRNLSFAYGEKKEFEKSLAVLNRAQQVFPDKNIAYGEEMFQMAKSYYMLNNREEWRRIVRIVVGHLIDKVRWYSSFDPKHDLITYYEVSKIGDKLIIMLDVIEQLDPVLAQEMNPEITQVSDLHAAWARNNSVIAPKYKKRNRQLNNLNAAPKRLN